MVSTGFASTIKTKPSLVIKTILSSPWFLFTVILLLWGFSLQFFRLNDMKDWGLISVFPIPIIVAYLLLVIGFAGLYLRPPVSDLVFGSYITLLVLMLHGTPMLLFGTLRYAWAWKHVGIIDYIIRHGAVNPTIVDLGVYHNWPGFFALNALFTQLAGFPGAQVYGGWAPAFFETFFAFGALALFRLFTSDRRLQWLGVWFFLLTNWVAQDYFAPQAMTYFMNFGVLILVLLGFGPKRTLSLAPWKRIIFKIVNSFRLPLSLVERIINLKLTSVPNDRTLTKKLRFELGIVIVLIFGVIVSSHQLTPFMSVAAALVLILFGITRWRTLPLLMIVLIVLWLAFPARAYQSEVLGSTSQSLGNVNSTVSSGLIDVAKVSPGQVVVSWMARGLSAIIILLAGLGFFQRIRKGYLDIHVILLAVCPVIVLFLNSYGGEALFRVYLFMIPYLSFLAAAAILPIEKPRLGWLEPITIGGLSLIMLIAFLFAYYGKERQYSFTKGEVDAGEYVLAHALPDSLLVEGSRNYPSVFLNYDFVTDIPLDLEPMEKIIANPAGMMAEWLSDTKRYRTSYLILTRSQKIYTDDVGKLPSGTLDRIQDALKKSPKFKVIFSNQDAIIFTLKEGN